MGKTSSGESSQPDEVFTSKNGFLTSRAQSKRMSAVKGSDTRAETALRQALWHSGLRYRKNVDHLPGRPDVAFMREKVALFVDGEFWHGQDWANRKRKLVRNRSYWVAKIERNMERDREVTRALEESGWRVMRFWSKSVLADPASCVAEVRLALEDQ